jgi:hypothetical protein
MTGSISGLFSGFVEPLLLQELQITFWDCLKAGLLLTRLAPAAWAAWLKGRH